MITKNDTYFEIMKHARILDLEAPRDHLRELGAMWEIAVIDFLGPEVQQKLTQLWTIHNVDRLRYCTVMIVF